MQNLAELRKEKGMTQEELANATGISLRTIQRIESGKVKPRAYSLKKMAQALNVQFNDLYQSDIYRPSNAFNLFKSNGRQLFIEIFYSAWATILFMLMLLNITCQVLGTDFLRDSLLFSGDFHLFRLAITATCIFALMQIYLLLIRKRLFSAVSYWLLLALFSAISMYLRFTSDLVTTAYATLNNIQ